MTAESDGIRSSADDRREGKEIPDYVFIEYVCCRCHKKGRAACTENEIRARFPEGWKFIKASSRKGDVALKLVCKVCADEVEKTEWHST